MKVMKFGSTSIGSPDRIRDVVQIVMKAADEEPVSAVVVSAFENATEDLIRLATQASSGDAAYRSTLERIHDRHRVAVTALVPEKNRPNALEVLRSMADELGDTIHGVFLVKELTPKTLDFITAFGERMSAFVVSEALNALGISGARCLDMRPLVLTDAHFGAARVDTDATYRNIREYFSAHPSLHVATGCIGSTPKGETTTLGRGGSDYTAALIGAALRATEVEIWTDADGVMTADPRKVKNVFSIESLSYEEAMELSHFGAREIYPPTLQPTSAQNIPVRIRNSFRPEFKGTCIGKKTPSAFLVTGISSIDRIALLRVEGSGMIGVVGISHRLFGALARNRISVILISQASSEHSICFAVTPQDADAAKRAIEQEFSVELLTGQVDPVVIENDLSIVAVVGDNMRKTPGISGRLFQALGKNGVNVVAIAQGSSELNISVVVPAADEAKSLNALHEAFFLSQTKTLNLFLLGTGLIGGTLLQQVREQRAILAQTTALDIRFVALGNVEKMMFQENGIVLESWTDALARTGETINLGTFIERVKAMNLPNSIFVDCTGSADVVDRYEEIFNASISIVTPNKIANSGPLERYRRLRQAAATHGVKFLYETNVGAGLPVIGTLNDLLTSGDRILKIEAVLSGTLSFIFNSVSVRKPFSTVVREAMAKGLSEPDPRDDLNGSDVARKILILARETGLALEAEDVALEPILSNTCRKAPTLNDFFRALEAEDKSFEARRADAEKGNRKLRYLAVLENGRAVVSLRGVGPEDPFYTLSGSDNMIVFTTERYRERPLVVKGPGAGADVTAAGVFADIVRIGNYLS